MSLKSVLKKNVKCRKCEREYLVPLRANFMFFCPECKEYNGCECDYGFGPITPCAIFVGDKEIGKITKGENIVYELHSKEYGIDIKLTKGYENLNVYDEVVSIIKEYLE